MSLKSDYVLAQPQTRNHLCHWPGCDKQVPPAMFMCAPHWFKLPKSIRDQIWRTFRPGQEKDWTPSPEYVAAAKAAQDWIAAFGYEAPDDAEPA
jgi:hypothetical protein